MSYKDASNRIAVIGLGYVGLPLAVEFAKKYQTIGFDLSNRRIEELNLGHDITLEVSKKALLRAIKKDGFSATSEISNIQNCNIYIVTVPTPVDKNNKPDMSNLINASETIGKILKKNDVVIYESTVYPGATEEVCIPVLERHSYLKFNKDFFCGYSPERINPGDKTHSVTDIKKVTSGSTPRIAKKIDSLYKSIINAGTYMAPSIKVAEAAKVIENAQRDINIAFINELSMIFEKINIDTQDVLDAASTKWNFLPFKPGLVGGHCIGVDPYYLAHKSKELGYTPKVILAGRELNDSMGKSVADKIFRELNLRFSKTLRKRVLILGLTFKENCPDIRNSKVFDVINALKAYAINISVFDPWADPREVEEKHNIKISALSAPKKYHAVVIAVSHKEFKNLGNKLRASLVNRGFIFDLKGALKGRKADFRL